VAETRSILLSGVTERVITESVEDERRQSLSSPSPGARRNSQQLRVESQAWGHVYFGNGASADCFVTAVALRRPSDASSGDEATTPTPEGDKVTIRARVRPRALERKPFLLQRTFDMNELRATIPEPSPTHMPGTPTTPRRLSVDLLGRTSSSHSRRRSSIAVKPEPSPELDKSFLRGANAMPLHLPYARLYLPVLAALMLSGHVRQGDIIDVPLPHPEAWSQTVAYVYTGQGELTEAMKQNILYLGGKL
jgi:hypothetical protein